MNKSTRLLPVFTIGFILAGFLAPVVCLGSVWQETRITGPGASPYTPKAWGEAVYWTDSRNYQSGYDEIRKWTPTTGEVVIGQRPYTYGNDIWSMYENRLVLLHGISSSNWDIDLYDIATGNVTPITTAPGKQQNADIYQNTVVYEDHSGTYSQVMIWDEILGSRPVSPAPNAGQINPKIWGEGTGQRVVWAQGGANSGIYSYTPSEGTQYIGPGISPAVYEDKVVGWTSAYQDPYWPYDYYPGSLWEWTPTGGMVTLAQHDSETQFVNTDMWGNIIVAEFASPGTGSSGILAWNPDHGLIGVSQSALGDQWSPSIYQNTVAWRGGNNIYLSTLIPEPSSLLALGSFMGGLLLMRRRKPHNC